MAVIRVVIVLLVLAAAGSLGFLYWSRSDVHRDGTLLAGGDDNTQSPPMATLGQFSPLDPPRPAPEVSFAARDGSVHRLADFRGHWLLVNLWATWCAPCVREMPSLERLQERLGRRLMVIAISEDRGGSPLVEPFREKLGLKALATYLDPKGDAGQKLAVRGLPTSFVIDREGCIHAKLEGAADWDSPEMLARLEHYLSEPDTSGIIKTSGGRG